MWQKQKSAKEYQFLAAIFCSELFSLPRNGSEWHSKSLLQCFFYAMEFRVVFSSVEGFGIEFRELLLFLFHGTEFRAFYLLRKGSERNSESFLFCGAAGIPPEIPICSFYSVFRGIIFLSEIPNPNLG